MMSETASEIKSFLQVFFGEIGRSFSFLSNFLNLNYKETSAFLAVTMSFLTFLISSFNFSNRTRNEALKIFLLIVF